MAWSVTAGTDQRIDAVERLAEGFLKNKIAIGDRTEAVKALTLCLDDPSAKVRKALARVVAQYENAPRALVWGLAQDIVEVSAEIYGRSVALRSNEFIEAIGRGEPVIEMAIAQRSSLDGPIIRALVNRGSEQAVLKLLGNQNVVLGPGLQYDIATRLGGDADIRAAMLADCNLAASTRQLLVERLSNSLLELTRKNNWGDEQRLSRIANDACNRVAVSIAMKSDPDTMYDYVEHLKATNQLTTALLVRACCMGHAALLETALATLSGTSLKRVQSIVDDGRISAFRSLYSRTGLPMSACSVFVAAIEEWQNPRALPDLVAGIIERVDSDDTVDGALLTLLGRISSEVHREAAQNYDRQLLLAA